MTTQGKESTTPRLLKAPEVAEILRATIFFIRSEIKAGHLKASKIGRAFLVEAADLDSYIKARAVKTDGTNNN